MFAVMTRWKAIAVSLALMAALPSIAYAGATEIETAWVRAVAPSAKAHAAYMTLVNKDKMPAVLTGVSSPRYGRAMLHLSQMVNGVATMTHQAQIEIPPGGRLEMKPGGFHVMLMMPKTPVNPGETVEITLQFADGATKTVAAPVHKIGPKSESGLHGHGAHSHSPATH